MKIRVFTSFSGQMADGRPFSVRPKEIVDWPGGEKDARRLIALGLAESIDDEPEPKPEPAVVTQVQDSVESYEIPPISPGARKLIAKNGISDEELEKIKPTGKGGRIVNSDVLQYLKDKNSRTNGG